MYLVYLFCSDNKFIADIVELWNISLSVLLIFPYYSDLHHVCCNNQYISYTNLKIQPTETVFMVAINFETSSSDAIKL